MDKATERFLIPRKGLTVRDPISNEPLPAEGMIKPWTGSAGRYWRRRVNCGDATEGKPSTTKPEKPEKKGGKD